MKYSRVNQSNAANAPHSRDQDQGLNLYMKTGKSQFARDGDERINEPLMRAYVDADLAGCTDTYKSTTGFAIMLYGGVISWMAKIQPTVALSTAEAETNAAVEAVKQLMHLRLLLRELGNEAVGEYPTKLYEDNNAAIQYAHGNENAKKAKHYQMKVHFLQEQKAIGIFDMVKVVTKEQLADTFTKPLAKDLFYQYRDWMGVVPGEE